MLKRGGKGTWKGPRVASIIRSSVPTMAFFLGLGIEFAHTCYKTCAHQSTRPAHGRLQASIFNTMVTQVGHEVEEQDSRSDCKGRSTNFACTIAAGIERCIQHCCAPPGMQDDRKGSPALNVIAKHRPQKGNCLAGFGGFCVKLVACPISLQVFHLRPQVEVYNCRSNLPSQIGSTETSLRITFSSVCWAETVVHRGVLQWPWAYITIT